MNAPSTPARRYDDQVPGTRRHRALPVACQETIRFARVAAPVVATAIDNGILREVCTSLLKRGSSSPFWNTRRPPSAQTTISSRLGAGEGDVTPTSACSAPGLVASHAAWNNDTEEAELGHRSASRMRTARSSRCSCRARHRPFQGISCVLV